MKKEDLCISVPSFFRCPISLDVMESPVSLCTGVTYDRSSIQPWLDGGNNTCPATMQVLTTKELLPNCTLHRLIDVWSESVRRRCRVESPVNTAPSREEIDGVIGQLVAETDDGNRLGLMRKIVRFARESAENREFLTGKEDFVPMLVDLMTNTDSKSRTGVSLQLVQLAVKILSKLKSRIGDRERLSCLILNNRQNCLTAIVLAFQRGNVESKIESLGLLESIAIDAESKLLIAYQDGFLAELMKSIKKGTDPSLIDASLSCLIGISKPKRVKLSLIRSKLVTDLTRLLTDPTDSSASITEKSLKLLAILSSCKEGGQEICGGGGDACLQAVVRKTLKVSTVATEQAVTVLWSLCCVIKEERAREAVAKSNGVTKILLLLQSNCSAAVRHMLTDLLKVFSISSGSYLSGYDTQTTHIMPF